MEENNLLKEEINKLKEGKFKLFQTDIELEKKVIDEEKEKEKEKEKENEKNNIIKQKEEELEQIKIKLSKYEDGTIIPEEVQKKIDEIKQKLLKYESGALVPEEVKKKMEEIKQDLNTEKEEIKRRYTFEIDKKEKEYIIIKEKNINFINELNSKLKEYREKVEALNLLLTTNNKEKIELEDIIIKQETKVNELGQKVNKIEYLIKIKNKEIEENENNSLKLINIIKKQKIQIQSLKKEYQNALDNSALSESNINTINLLKTQMNSLKKKLEVKEDSMLNLQKSHKILQEKYLKICTNKRIKEQELFMNQARKLKKEKIERERDIFFQKKRNFLKFNDLVEKNYSSIFDYKRPNSPNLPYQNQNISNDSILLKVDNSNINKNDNNNHIIMGTVLPMLKSSKNKERIERIKLKNNEDVKKMEEINDMMSKIINEF